MENPAEKPIDGWLQINVAVKRLLQMGQTLWREKIEQKKYVVFAFHDPSSINHLFAGTMAAGSQIPTLASVPSTSTDDQAVSTAPTSPPYAETSKKTSVQESTSECNLDCTERNYF